VLIGGYFKIFGDLLTYSRDVERKGEAAPVSPDVKTWDTIGNEFRQLIYDCSTGCARRSGTRRSKRGTCGFLPSRRRPVLG